MDFADIREAIAQFPDFPQPGVRFWDISPLLENPDYFTFIVDAMAAAAKHMGAIKIVAIDARGFLFGSAIAYKLHKSLVICRKKGKLPGKLITKSYEYEYSNAEISIQENKLTKTDKVIIIDDVLATGNTARAAWKIIDQHANVSGFLCLIELDKLDGRKHLCKTTSLQDNDIISFIHY